MQQYLTVNARLRIPISELVIRASRSSGPGGQHANVTASRIEVVFYVEQSEVLSSTQKRLIKERCGDTVRAVAQEHRSQARNRELALERLAARIRQLIYIQPKRVKTKPSRGAKERRLKQKHVRAQHKRSRQKPLDHDS